MYSHINYNWKKKVTKIYHVNGLSRRLPKKYNDIELINIVLYHLQRTNTSISGHGLNITKVYVGMNGNIELTCDCFHHIQCSWSTPNRKNSFIDINTKSGKYNLIITNVSTLDVVNYTCKVWEAGALHQKLLNLQLQQVLSLRHSLEDHPYFISSSLPTSSTLTKYPPETNKSYHEHDRDDLFHEYIPSDLVPLDHCRFLCELEYLASQLRSCTGCDKPLHLHNASGVRCYGVSGILYIICHRPICGRLNKIKLGKPHYPGENKRGIGVFDVNTKIATGMIHSGIGGTQLSNFLSVLNIHSIDFKALKERENETGAALEAQAEISEERYLQDEINQSFTEENGNTQTGISVSTDTCWQKKGSGRSYNSLSGVSTLIGTKTGKVVDHRLRISSCKICEKARSKEMIPRKHQCRKNWSGSAKGMEPDMVVEMLKGLDDKDIVVSQL
ncbi:unnamed protein product [Mytilus coruscus]|uniref:Immunoglobulin domain-containing protein n=1 Tax=Mytilus coruscus TaxID=42192 RepID=A0A6J7ZZY1_MYTCO|nr:unnamed protein product [Mytilus coruscus]